MMIQDQFGDNGGGPRPAPQAHDDPPGTRLGTCPECGQTVAVTNDGKVGRHTATDRKNPGIWYHCPAEGRPPLTIVTP